MTFWLIGEGWDSTLVLVVLVNGWLGFVSEQMLVSTLSASVNPHLKSWAEAAVALAPLRDDSNFEDLLSPCLLMWCFKN